MPLIAAGVSGSFTLALIESWSSGCGPDVMFCISAASARLRVIGPQ